MIYGVCREKLLLIPTVSYVRSFKRCDMDALLADLRDAPWQVTDAADDIDEKWVTWKSLFMSVVDQHAPLVKVRVKKSRCDWLTAEIRTLMRSRNYHYRQYLKSRSQATWERYKTLRNEVNRQIRQAKASHFITISQEMRQQPKLAWSKLNAALGRARPCAPLSHYITSKGTPPDESTLANSLIDHFSAPPAKSTRSTNPTTSASCSTTFCFSKVTEVEVLKKLSNLDAGKATGPDRISARLLRTVASSIAPSITSLFNASLVTGQFPSEWKEANITPVPKPGGKRDFNSLRPISVLPVLAKVLESLVASQLTDFLETNKLLSDAQSGFRSNHSTQDVLLKCVDDWKAAIDKGKVVGTVMIDLSKAFDSICHSLLLRKLEATGVRDTALTWFSSYLTGRRQRVLTHSACSEWRHVTTGVPQGSILGPLLFLIFVNDLPAVVQHCSISLYADDTSIYVSNPDPSTVGNLLEEDLRHICKWLECNGLKINVEKTQLMVLCSHQKSHQEDQVEVKIGTSVLQKQKSVKYLGVTVDKHLRWHLHIDNVRKNCLGKIAAIRRASSYLPGHIRRTLYLSFVLPHLEYCSVAWNNCGATLTSRLERVQNYALCVILNKPPRSNTEEMQSQLSLPSLSCRRKISTIMQVRRCLSRHAPDYLCSKFTARASILTDHPSTRGAKDLHLKAPRTNLYKSSFEYSGAKLYNDLPNDLKSMRSDYAFRKALLMQYISPPQ